MVEPLEARRLLSAGDLDPGFGSSGVVVGSTVTGQPFPEEALTPDGGIVVTRSNEGKVTKYTSTGALSPSFGSGGVVNLSTLVSSTSILSTDAIAVQPDGKILVAGEQSANSDGYVLRLTATGQLDTSWHGDGLLAIHFPGSGKSVIGAMSLQPDGKVVVAGNKGSILEVARANSDGTLDTFFSTDGYAGASYTGKTIQVFSMVVRADGRIDAGGRTIPSTGSTGNVMITQFNANGTLDTSFDSDGRLELAEPDQYGLFRTLIERPNGKLLACGQLSSASGPSILQFNANGSLDPAFGGGDGIVQLNIGGGLDYPAEGMALEPGGHLLVSAARDIDASSTVSNDVSIFALNADGSADTSFGTSGVVTTDLGTASDTAGRVLIQPDGKILQSGGKAYLEDPFGPFWYPALMRFQGYPGSIAGHLFNDLDHDGVHDSGEPNLVGRTVYLDLDGDSSLDSNEPVTQTDSNGNYVFPGLDPATYVVREVLPDAQWSQTSPAGTAGRTVNVASDAVTGIDFGSADFVPPVASDGAFHPDTLQMSVKIHFSEDVALAVGSSPLSVTFSTTGQPIQGHAVVSNYDSTAHDATFTFNGYPSGILPNGTYHADLAAGSVSDVNGVASSADYSFDFAVLAADGDQSGKVDLRDFNLLATNFGKSNQTFLQGNYDYSTDGRVNLLDFNILATNFGRSSTMSSSTTTASVTASSFTASRPISSRRVYRSTLLTDAGLVGHQSGSAIEQLLV